MPTRRHAIGPAVAWRRRRRLWGGAGAMSGRALPLLFLNLGGEMLYILDQRLRAQSIPGEKARKGEPGLGQGGRHRGDPVWTLPCPAL